MSDPLLPTTIPHRLGAVLAGRSLAGYMRHIAPSCSAITGGTTLAALEMLLGVSFEPAAYLAAERRLDALRARERHSKRNAA